MDSAKEILILGGTGKTGRRVATRLASRDLLVKIGSRTGSTPFFWEEEASWAASLRGVSAVYVAYSPDLGIPGAARVIRSFVEAAEAGGVERLVLLSGRGEDEAQRAEQEVIQSGLAGTILRCSWFSQNFSESFLLDAVRGGEVVLPVGAIGEPFVDADDVADAAVAALTDAGHNGQLYELTGPTLRTFAEAVVEIGQATGRTIAYRQVSSEQFKDALKQQGAPQEVIWLLDYLFTTILDGRNALLTDGVQRALGRKPKDFADYVRETAATGVWSPFASTGETQ